MKWHRTSDVGVGWVSNEEEGEEPTRRRSELETRGIESALSLSGVGIEGITHFGHDRGEEGEDTDGGLAERRSRRRRRGRVSSSFFFVSSSHSRLANMVHQKKRGLARSLVSEGLEAGSRGRLNECTVLKEGGERKEGDRCELDRFPSFSLSCFHVPSLKPLPPNSLQDMEGSRSRVSST